MERRLLPHDEGLARALGVKGPFNSDDTFRVAVTLNDKGACAHVRVREGVVFVRVCGCRSV